MDSCDKKMIRTAGIAPIILSCFFYLLAVSATSQTLKPLRQEPKQIEPPYQVQQQALKQPHHFGEAWGGSSDNYGLSIANTGMGDGIRGFAGSNVENRAGIVGIAKSTQGKVHGVYGITESYASGSAGVMGLGNSLTGLSVGVIGQTVSNMNGAMGILGAASAATGQTIGVMGRTNSASDLACGIVGLAEQFNGKTYGVHGKTISQSEGAAGVFGLASHFQGLGSGVFGLTESQVKNAKGIYGLASSSSGQTYGVYGETRSETDFAAGIHGIASGSSGQSFGVYGEAQSQSNSAAGVYGVASSRSGRTYGVRGELQSAHPAAAAGYFIAANRNGKGAGVWAETNSDSGYAIYAKGNVFLNGDVSVAGDLKFYGKWNAKTSYISLSPAAFRPSQNYDTYFKESGLWDSYNWSKQIAEAHYWVNSGAALDASRDIGRICFIANVSSPHGALLKKITCSWNNPGFNKTAELKFYQVIRGKHREDSDILAIIRSNNTTKSVYELSASVNEQVNNLSCSYFISLDLPGGFEFYGVLIEYEISEPY